jgi:hypothetical protein
MTVTYLDRSAWGAGPVRVGYSAPHGQFVGLVAHHTVFVISDYDGDGIVRGDLDDIKRYMRRLKTMRPDLGDDVPYSFVVFEGARPGDCVVAEGRGFGRTGAHTQGYNSTRYGVALAGNSSARPVTEGILSGYRWVGRKLARPEDARATIGHRDTKPTECPGTSLYAALPKIQPPFTDPTTPPAPPVPTPEEGKMLWLIKGANDARWWLTDMITKRHVENRDDAAVIVFMAEAADAPLSHKDGGPHVLSAEQQGFIDRIPTVE